MKKEKVIRFIDELLRLFRDMEITKVDEIIKIFRKNDDLRLEGYGWKRVRIRCDNPKCRWEGKRVWRKEMFDEPCLRCKSVSKRGKTSLFCPPHVVY